MHPKMIWLLRALTIHRPTRVRILGREADANFQLAAIQGIGPKDAVETLIATQLAAVHALTMAAARRLAQADTLAHEVALNKLSRTFAALVTTLKNYRTGASNG
jgi:D-alanyl-D-alanine dipeptidase